MKHRSFERGVCSEFSCALLREWPVGTDLSQVSGLRWRSEPANFVIEGEPDLSTLGSVEKATQSDLRVSSSCLPEYRKYLFYLGPCHWAPWGAMGWCQGSHIPTSWTVTNKPQTETSSQRLAACVSKWPISSWAYKCPLYISVVKQCRRRSMKGARKKVITIVLALI